MIRLKNLLQSKVFLGLSLIFLVFYVFIFTNVIKYHSKYDGSLDNIEGKVLGFKIDGDKLSIELKAKEKIQLVYYIKTEEELDNIKDKLKMGSFINAQGVFSLPSNNTIPNTFNYKKYLYNKKIYYIFNATNINIKNNNISFIYKIKNMFLDRVKRYTLTSSYMQAFILGDKSNIDADIYQSFQNNGVTHLFAVSGMHVSFLVMALNNLLKKLKLKDNKINLIIILFLAFYMFLIGFTASVVRASLLYIFLLINKKFNLRLPTIIVLYLLFLILVIINPFYVYDLGFIYSFLTSFGLILFSKKITGNYIVTLLKVSTIAFLFSLPVTLSNFYDFNILTIFNNILIVPLVSLILFPLTLITFFFPFLEILLNWGFNILEIISMFTSKLSINIIVPKINILFIIIYYIFILLIYKKGFKYSMGLVILIIIFKLLPYLNNNSYVYYLDVGQGDSALLVTKNRQKVIMIDTGGKITYEKDSWQVRNNNYNISDNIITFMKSMGISKIDYLISSHGDMDHIGEALNIVNNFRVKEVIFNNDTYNDLENKLIKDLNKKKIKYSNNISELTIDKNRILFLNTRKYDNENDNSNVLYLNYDNYKFLFMGDAGINREKDILNNYDIEDIDFLKVGHHGSITSSSKYFINHIKPKYAIISVGKNNRYGHPDQEVLKNLVNSKIYRTDLNGSIEVLINKNKYKLKTYEA